MKKIITKNKKVLKKKTTKSIDKTDDVRISKTFRLLQSDIKKLQRIASLKKANQTRVISELIRLAHEGLFRPEMKALDKFYKIIIREGQKQIDELDKMKLKDKDTT